MNKDVFDLLLAQHERNIETLETRNTTTETLDLDQDIMYKLLLEAEAEDISFNTYVNDILKRAIL